MTPNRLDKRERKRERERERERERKEWISKKIAGCTMSEGCIELERVAQSTGVKMRLIEATAGSLAVDTRPRLELATSMLVALALPSQISVRPRELLRRLGFRV